MKISFEFTSIQDMLQQMPKFAQLVAGEGTSEERMAIALEDDPTPLIFKITPKDGIPFTEEEKEAIKAVISKYTDEAKIEKIEKLREELAPESAESAESAAPEAPEEKPKKNPPKAKKAEEPSQEKAEEAPAEESVTETEARKALNGLVKARTNAAVKLVFHELGIKNFNDLKDNQYAEATALAEKVGGMTDEEYEAALKEAGIKGGKK